MVQKIQSREYLKRFDNMTASERGEVMTRVGEWLDKKAGMLRRRAADEGAKLRNVVQVSAGWNDVECEAWQEGVRLLSAWGVGLDRGWWPEGVYAKSAKRSIGWVVAVLSEKGSPYTAIPEGEGGRSGRNNQSNRSNQNNQRTLNTQTGAGGSNVPQKERKGGDAIAGQQTKEPQAAQVTTPRPAREGQGGGSADGLLVPARPKHIDQYVHLLPKGTQERAGEYGPLMRELDVAREKMRLLMEDGHASASQREQWAKRAVALEKKAKGILVELDREWERIVREGKVKVDALGMAYIDRPSPDPSLAGRGVDTTTPEETPAANVTTPLHTREGQGEGLDLRRAGLLRKWLIDLRYGNTEGKRRERYLAKWRAKYREMVRLGGKGAVTEKVVAAAKHYGVSLIDLDKEGADA